MSDERQLGLLCNLPRVQAQARIFEEKFDPTDYESVYKLYLAAHGDEDLAQQAQTEAAKQLVKRDTEAARLAKN